MICQYQCWFDTSSIRAWGDVSDVNAVKFQDCYVDVSVFNLNTPPKNIYSLKLSLHWWEVPWQENDHKDEIHDLLDPNSTSKIVGTITLGYTAEVLYLLCKFNHLQVSASPHVHVYLGIVIELYSNKCKSGLFSPRFGPWFLCTGYLFNNLSHFFFVLKMPTNMVLMQTRMETEMHFARRLLSIVVWLFLCPLPYCYN